MEDPDGFIRTLPDSPAPQHSDDDGSELMFASDDDASAYNTNAPFFEVSRPAAWDFSAARKEAEAPRPFQTTVDEKIRGALSKVSSHDLPSEINDQADATSKSNHTVAPSDTHVVESDNSDSDSEQLSGNPLLSSLQPSGEADQPQTPNSKVKKGKKRLRKEKSIAKSFTDLHLSKPLQKVIDVLQWLEPTPIQSSAIPYVLAGRDVCGSAVTGSGKTAAFVLPILERLLRAGIDNVTRVIILLPTRELAAQCHAVIQSMAKYTSIRAALAVGGLSNKAQEVALRTRPHIIVATPGRLIDHVRNAHSFSLEDIEVLVMDEADRLLEMGFKAEVDEILRATPTARQTLLFSATINPQLKGLIKLSLRNPINLNVDPLFDVASTLAQEFVKLRPAFEANKDALLFALVTRAFKSRTIIFFRQKVTAHQFKIMFGLTKLKSAELHGNLTQAQRLSALDSFKDGSVDYLLCTDLAARGLDIAGVETVINYDMPGELKEYVHRVGRTARAGNLGRACTIVRTGSNDERRLLKNIAKRAKGRLGARVVPPSVIGKWRVWLDVLRPALKCVLREERQEKEMRLAEMELKKAGNLMAHSKDIYTRPARTWFQTENEKKDEKSKARREKGLPETNDEKSRRSTREKKTQEAEKRKRRRETEEQEHKYSKQRADAKKSKRKKSRRV